VSIAARNANLLHLPADRQSRPAALKVVESLGGAFMDKATLVASLSTGALVLGLVILRLLFAGSQIAAGAGLGRGPKLSPGWRRWLFGESAKSSK